MMSSIVDGQTQFTATLIVLNLRYNSDTIRKITTIDGGSLVCSSQFHTINIFVKTSIVTYDSLYESENNI